MKNNKEKKFSIVFYLLSFTIAIFIFSIGNSAISSERRKLNKFSEKNNKILSFSLREKLTLDELKRFLGDDKITIILKKNLDGTAIYIESYLKTDGYFYEEDMKKGKFFTKEEFESLENKVIKTERSKLKDNIEVKYVNSQGKDKTLKTTSIGTIFSKENKIVAPAKVFLDVFEDIDLNDSDLKIIMAGDEKELEKSIGNIKKHIKDINTENELEVNDYLISNKSEEGRVLKIMSYLVVLVAVINSFGICSLWIDSREKEIVMRKVVGATNIEILKIFFKDLGKIATISLFVALGGQAILSFALDGYFMLINIKITAVNIVYSIMFTIFITLLTTIPFLKKINKLSLVEMLKED